ncbi:hypothetical protein [Amycolatopsis sp. NPDC051903]|uniref:hypothetical protein n=1 Tax=Amycolatopsis sp. NPDC051903 TaxID=3363936 RepID=UPI003796D086
MRGDAVQAQFESPSYGMYRAIGCQDDPSPFTGVADLRALAGVVRAADAVSRIRRGQPHHGEPRGTGTRVGAVDRHVDVGALGGRLLRRGTAAISFTPAARRGGRPRC